MYKIGVDLGGTNIAVGIVNEENVMVANAHTPTDPGRGAQAVVDDMAECISNALQLSGIGIEECLGIGVGSPGTCDAENGVVVQAFNLGWFQVPVCRMLSERFGIPAYLGNDADCAALGEVVAGAAVGSRDALMVTLGTGVGGGVIIDGRIYAGHHTLGGEAGHMCICMDGEPCTCGEKGCWEAYASATALIRQGERAAAVHPESRLNAMGKLDGLKIFTAMHDGDETAAQVVEAYCRYVAVGLVNLVNVLYPEVIILGGGICAQGETLLAPVRRYIAEHFFVGRPEVMPRLVTAKLGNDAGIIGAAALCGGR